MSKKTVDATLASMGEFLGTRRFDATRFEWVEVESAELSPLGQMFKEAGASAVKPLDPAVVERGDGSRTLRNMGITFRYEGETRTVSFIPQRDGLGVFRWERSKTATPSDYRVLHSALAKAVRDTGTMSPVLEELGIEPNEVTTEIVASIQDRARDSNDAEERMRSGHRGLAYALLGLRDGEGNLVKNPEYKEGERGYQFQFVAGAEEAVEALDVLGEKLAWHPLPEGIDTMLTEIAEGIDPSDLVARLNPLAQELGFDDWMAFDASQAENRRSRRASWSSPKAVAEEGVVISSWA